MTAASALTGAVDRGGTRGRRTAVLAVLLLVLVILLGDRGPAAAQEHEGDLVVEVTALDPAFLAPGEPLSVRGTIRNDSADPLSRVTVTLALQTNPPSTRFALDSWLNPAARYATLLLERQTLEDPLAPGASAPFSFTVDPGDVPLSASPSSWGPRGVSVSASGRADGGSLAAEDRTFVVWNPTLPVTPDRVSIVVPLAPRPAELLGAVLAEESVPSVSADRIRTLAGATAAVPLVTWALDPLLLEPEEQGDATATPSAAPPSPPDGPTAPATPAPGDAGTDGGPADVAPSSLADTLLPLTAGREVLALPYADADVAALAHHDRLELYDAAAEAGRALTDAAHLPRLDGLAWPAATHPDAATVAALAERGANAVVLPQASLPLADETTYTPTGRGTVTLTGEDGQTQEIAALLAEPTLSAALAGRVPRRSLQESDDAEAADLAARQYVLALTAMISRERPNDVQHLLAVVPRAFDGDPAALGERISALSAAPWVDLAPLSVLLGTAQPGLPRAELTAKMVEDDEIPAQVLGQVVRARAALQQFASIAADPTRLVLEEQRRLLQVTSAAWRADPGGRSSFANAASAAAAELPSQVAVLPTGTVNLISETGQLPITVRNSLDQPIRGYLQLTTLAPSLQVPELVAVEAPAGSEVAVGVDVRAVGSADVEVRAQLLDSQGRPVGEQVSLFVRVRADWENVGTAVLAGLLGVVFLLGLVRSIRRARRRRAAAAAGAAP